MLIDLSVPLNETTPRYPGDPETKITPAGTLEHEGYQGHYVSVGTHVGTHMDAPSHMLQDGKNLDQFPIDQFSGHGVYIDCTRGFALATFERAEVTPGAIVLLHTGMDASYDKPGYFTDYPSIPEEVARYLVGKKIKMIGVDMCSPDHPPFAIHKILLGAGILIIENLTNLAALKGKRFRVFAFPIKLGIDAAPVRVVAEVITT